MAKWLRREHLVSSPIIFISSRKIEDFDLTKNGILKAAGSGVIQPRSTPSILKEQIDSIKSLSNEELKDVVRNYCGLGEKWENFSHKIGNLLMNYKHNHLEIKELTNQWAKSINYFTPEKAKVLKKFQVQLNKPSTSVNTDELKQAKQNLDDALKGKKSNNSAEIDIENLPKFPPKGYSKVLIADDEPLDSLVSGLQVEYRYTIVGQAQGSNEAERLLIEKKPDVVLSDYYFKKYARDKTTDKKFGGDFMITATNFNIGSQSQPQNPIVAVISKTSLDKEDIPIGVLDFSGTFNATNSEFVHRGIWLEAIKQGITEPEIIEGHNWSLEYQCRYRLEPYKSDLPKLIRQWDFFKNSIRETLEMTRSLPLSKNAEDTHLIESIKKTLEPFENAKDFSIKEVSEIFVKVERDHKKAKQSPDSKTKTQIRNILHGKIEQFSKVVNHINSALKVFAEVSSDLSSLPKYKKIGVEFKEKISNFRDNKPLLPILNSFQEVVNKILDQLPEIPKIKNPVKAKNSIPKKIHILIAEDDKFWSETVRSAIETVKVKLGDNFQVTYEPFENIGEAIKAVPIISQTPLKKESDEAVKYIAVVDICLPDKNKKGQIPNPENGITLIKTLSEYKANVPLIVFSTKASLVDRRVIGRLGIPDGNFIVKDYDAEPAITGALISLIEKKDKYVIRRIPYERNGILYYDFLINSLQIPLPPELNLTFQALYELKEDRLLENQLLFSADEINKKRSLLKGEKPDKNKKNPVLDHMYRIRELIHEIFQRNNRYIDTRELIKTIFEDEDFFYQLNAELPTLDDEDFQSEDYENFRNKVFKILIIGKNSGLSKQIADALKRKNEKVLQCETSEDIEEIARNFYPDIVLTELDNIKSWNYVKTVLHDKRLGIIVTTTNEEENRLVQEAIKSGVPISNFVSINEPDWINSLLMKLNHEKHRVFLGKIEDSSQESKEPIVEILGGSNLSEGKLKLRVNDKILTPNKSNQAKILGYLLRNPGIRISLDTIKKKALGINKPVTDNYLNKLVERIRTQIQENWLKTDDRELAMQILESSANGMQLNAQVINLQED